MNNRDQNSLAILLVPFRLPTHPPTHPPTSPLQLAQTVLRLQDSKHKGTLDCLRKLYADGGLAKLFTGMRAKLLQTVLTAAFTFLTYEQILGVVQTALTSAVGMRKR